MSGRADMRPAIHASLATLATTVLLLACVPAPGLAGGWLLDGTLVSPPGAGFAGANACSDGSGGSVIAWVSDESWGMALFATRLDATGKPVWAQGPVLVSPAGQPTWTGAFLVPDGSGGAIVTWADSRSGKAVFYAQRVDAAGNLQWAPAGATVDTTLALGSMWLGLASDGAGGSVVSWCPTSFDGAPDHSVRAQRIDATGTARWTPGGVALSPDAAATGDIRVSGGPSGGTDIVWTDARNGWTQVRAQWLDANGVVQGPEGGIALSSSSAQQFDPAIASDGAGGIIASWTEGAPTSPSTRPVGPVASTSAGFAPIADPGRTRAARGATLAATGALGSEIHAQRLTAAGALAWGSTGVLLAGGATARGNSGVASDEAGGAIFAWEDLSGAASQVLALRLNGSGASLWSGAHSATPTTGAQTMPFIVADRAHGAVLTWVDTRNDLDGDLYAMRLDGATGNSLWARRPLPVCQAPGSAFQRAMIPDGQDGATLAWLDFRTAGTQGCYATRIGLPDLDDIQMHSVGLGWSSPTLVTNGSVTSITGLQLPAVLNGNVPTTYGHWSMYVSSLLGGGLNWLQVGMLDNETTLWSTSTGPNANVTIFDYNKGPFTVRGGRHTISNTSDPLDVQVEFVEDNNAFRGQWVWSPLSLAPDAGVSRAAAPQAGPLPLPNCDGFRWLPTPGASWVVAAAPRSALDNYDMVLYDDYTGSTSGFSHELARSSLGGNATDFVLGVGAGLPDTLYPGVVRTTASALQAYSISASDASSRRGAASGTDWLGEALAGFTLARVYELDCTDTSPVKLLLKRVGGTYDLDFAVFPSTPGLLWARATIPAGGASVSGPNRDTLVFTPPSPGVYPVVVYRVGGTSIGPETFDFVWGPNSTVDVPRTVPQARLEFAGAAPNPTFNSTRFGFSLPSPGPARLALFDVSGRCVRVLVDGIFAAGRGTVTWDGRGDGDAVLPAGLYWARFTAAGETITRRTTLLR